MKKIMTILAIILFAFTSIGGSVFYLADIPAAVQEEQNKDNFDEDGETNTTASGYWTNSSYYASSFDGGTGESDSPYLISTAAQLARMAYLINSSSSSSYNTKYYELTADIDLSAHYWVPIANTSSLEFRGSFFGGYHVIKNMTCYMSSATDSYYSVGCALFGIVKQDADISCFSLTGINITTASVAFDSSKYYKFSGVAAQLSCDSGSCIISYINIFGTITCSFTGTPYELLMGGAVGYAQNAAMLCIQSYVTIKDSGSNSSSSSNAAYCGGIVGWAATNCNIYATAMLGYIDFYGLGTNSGGGGLVGQLSGGAQIKESYAVYGNNPGGSFWLSRYAGGGLVGKVNNGKIISSWSYLDIYLNSSSFSSKYRGGMVGYASSLTIYCVGYRQTSSVTGSVGYGSYSGGGGVIFSSLSNLRRSSTFNSYMQKDSYSESQKWWYGSPWNFDSDSYNHLNYGFPVIQSLCADVYVNSNEYVDTCGVKTTGTGVDTSYTSGGNDGTQSYGVKFLIGGDLYITSKGKSTCYFRYLSKYTDDSVKVTSSTGTSTSYSASITQCAGKFTSLHGSTSNTIYFYVFYSAPTASYWQNNYASSFAGGSGTSASPYLISNGAQLARLAYLSNSESDSATYNSLYYKLTDDIDISGKLWTPIGLNKDFMGNFDGCGYTIKGLDCTFIGDSDPVYSFASTSTCLGLFGTINDGTVSNFVLVDVRIGGDTKYQNMVGMPTGQGLFYSGAVAARFLGGSESATISKVGVYGDTIIRFWDSYSGGMYIGGLVGYMCFNASLSLSFNYSNIYYEKQYGKLQMGNYMGGLVGFTSGSSSYYPIIDNCYNAGSVSCDAYETGGLIGRAAQYGEIKRCYNIGTVFGFYRSGGLVGNNWDSGVKFYNCFVDAKVSNDFKWDKYNNTISYDYVGALAAINYGTFSYCGYSSEKCSTQIKTNNNSSGVTNITSFTSTIAPPNKNYVNSFYASGTYTWNYATYLTTNASYIWCKPYGSSSDRYLNDCYPVLTWSLRQRYVGTNFSQCGTTTMAAVGDGATAGESQATYRYLILGMKIKIFTTPTVGAYGDYTGIYETKASNTSTKVKISDEPTYYEFTPGDTFDNIRVAFNGNQNDSWISFNLNSNFTTGTTYRVYFVDNNTYGTSGASYSLKNICFKRLSYGSWYTMSLPEIKETGQGSIVNKTSDSVDWQANAISGNTYSFSKVLLYKGDTYVSALSSAKKEYSTVSVKAQKSYEFTYNSSTANRLRIGLNGNQADACFVISASQTSMASGGTYRIIFVDNTTTYGTAGKGGSFSNIRLQYKYGNNWEDREIPDALSTDNCTVTRVDRFTLKFSGSAISGNTYSNSKVQFWKDDTYVSEISAKTISATTQYYWTTFVRGNVSNGSSNYAYYAIYTSKPVTVNVRVAAYTPYDNAVNYPTSTSTVGSFRYTRYTSGFPLTTTILTSTNTYSVSFSSYVYRSITLSTITASSAWKFKGWYYSSTSTTISASTCAGTPTYSSSSYSFTPASNSTIYYIAVFVPDQRTVTFGGVYTSEDDGATYTRKITSSSYPMATLKYVKPTYSAIVNGTQTSQYSTTSSATTITYTYSKTWSLSISSNSNYTFVGWYYGTDGNTLLSSSTTYSSSGAMYDNLRAKFKRKVVNYDVYIMTDEGTGTYKNSASGGNPTFDYYNRTNNYTHATLTATNHFEIQAGTNISIGYSNDYYAKPGYIFMGVNSTTATPTYQSNYPLNIRNITASNSTNNKLYFFYKKTTANRLKHAVKNFAKISNVSVTNPSGSSFAKNSNDFYESQNFGVNNSYALAKVSFTLANSADVTFEYISAGEMTCDYGIFSDIDTTLTSSNSIDTTNVKLSTYGGFNDGTLRQVVYKNVSAGSHYIYIKYRKDSSIHTKYDSLQFRLVTEYSNSSYWYFEDGEYPQSYVGSSMNNTLTNNASFVGYLDYNNGKADITSSSSSSENIIKIYSYSGKKYAAMKAPKTQTLTMNDGNTYTFSAGNLYFFAFEPIRWEVKHTKMPNINAFETDGSAYRTLPSSLKYEDALTVNLWAYMDDWSEYQAQDMVMLSTGEKGFKIDTSSSGGYIRYSVYDDGVGYKYAEMLGKTWAALASGWHMFTFTFDGSYVRGYVDGGVQGPDSSTFTSGKIGYDSNSQIYVGKEYGTTRSFVGKIDYENIDIINRVLSSSEISNAYIQSDVYKEEEIWSFGDYKNCFDAVSHNVLGFGAVASDLTSIQEGWKFENSNMYKNVSKNPNSSNAIANETFKYKQTDSSVLYTKTLNWGSTPSNNGDIYDYINVDNITEGEQYVLNVTLESGTITASGFPAIVVDIVKSDNSGLTIRNNAEIYFKTGVTSYSATLTVKEQTVEEGSHLKVWFWKDSTYVITPENAVVKIEIRRIPAHDYQYFTPSSGQDKIGSYALLEENVRVASMKELEENLNDLRANASDMVAVFMGVSADKYCEYWTRDLGLYLKNGYTITSTGQKKSAWLNRVSGARFSITFAEGSLNF